MRVTEEPRRWGSFSLAICWTPQWPSGVPILSEYSAALAALFVGLGMPFRSVV